MLFLVSRIFSETAPAECVAVKTKVLYHNLETFWLEFIKDDMMASSNTTTALILLAGSTGTAYFDGQAGISISGQATLGFNDEIH